MLNHAAEVNRKRMDLRIKRRRELGRITASDEIADMPTINGRKITELTSDELISYHSKDGPRPRIIKPKGKT